MGSEVRIRDRQQADKDLAEMRALVPAEQVSDDEVANFCQNVFNLDVLQPRTLREEYYLYFIHI